MIGNKIADKITSVSKPRNKEKKRKIMKQIKCKKFTYHQNKDSKLLMI